MIDRLKQLGVTAALLGACIAVCSTTAVQAGTDPNYTPPHVDLTYPTYQPPYPTGAQQNGEQGSVILDVQVSDTGHVRSVGIFKSSGFPDLDNAAVEGVMSWHFVPAKHYGATEADSAKVKIDFTLPSAAPAPAPAPH